MLDIERGNSNPDAKVIMYKKKSPPGRNQLWYIDQQGIIRSALNDFALQGHGKSQSSGVSLFVSKNLLKVVVY